MSVGTGFTHWQSPIRYGSGNRYPFDVLLPARIIFDLQRSGFDFAVPGVFVRGP
jgi:hypothetical protein